MAKSHMTPDMLEYLVAACDETQGDLEKQVDAAVLRRKLKFSPEEDLNAQRGLQYRGYITTKGAGEGNVGFFWVTEEGVQAAIREGELTGNARFLREFWNNSSSQEVFEGILHGAYAGSSGKLTTWGGTRWRARRCTKSSRRRGGRFPPAPWTRFSRTGRRRASSRHPP